MKFKFQFITVRVNRDENFYVKLLCFKMITFNFCACSSRTGSKQFVDSHQLTDTLRVALL